MKSKTEKNAVTAKKKNGMQRLVRDIKKYPSLYLMIVPVIVYYLIFHYAPMSGLIMAFKDYVPAKGIWGSDWVGFEHFIAFFNDIYFFRVLKNTLTISIGSIIFGFPAPIILALLLNEVRNRYFGKTVQTISYMPHFISLVVVCGLIKQFTLDTGVITQLLLKLGIDTGTMLTQPKYFVPIYIISDIWQNVGWDAIIYMAALSSIDQQLYEAAQIDGANKFKQLLHVTFPGLLPTVMMLLILRVGSVMSVGMEKIILLYNELTFETADVISSYVYRKGLQEFNFSYASAVGMFNSIINFVLIIVVNQISKKTTETSMW